MEKVLFSQKTKYAKLVIERSFTKGEEGVYIGIDNPHDYTQWHKLTAKRRDKLVKALNELEF